MPTFSPSWSVKPTHPGFSPSRWWWGVTASCPDLPDIEVVRPGIAEPPASADLFMRAHRSDLRERLERAGFEVVTVRDATAGTANEEGDGYRVARATFRFPARARWTTEEPGRLRREGAGGGSQRGRRRDPRRSGG